MQATRDGGETQLSFFVPPFYLARLWLTYSRQQHPVHPIQHTHTERKKQRERDRALQHAGNMWPRIKIPSLLVPSFCFLLVHTPIDRLSFVVVVAAIPLSDLRTLHPSPQRKRPKMVWFKGLFQLLLVWIGQKGEEGEIMTMTEMRTRRRWMESGKENKVDRPIYANEREKGKPKANLDSFFFYPTPHRHTRTSHPSPHTACHRSESLCVLYLC